MSGIVRTAWARNMRASPRVPADLPPFERVTIPGNMGGTLAGMWFPAEKPKGAVVLAHPWKREGKRYFLRTGWVRFLHEAGYDVLAFDFTPFGESRGRGTYLVEDLANAVGFARKWAGGLPVHVVGVSYGAFMAANAAPLMGDVGGMVLESPYPTFRDWYKPGTLPRAGMRAFDALFPRTARMLDATANLPATTARRVLVVAAGGDDVTAPALSEAVARAGPAGRTRLLTVTGARHLEPFDVSTEYRQAVLEALA